MGEATKIEWCDHTFNPWLGCTAVSPGCDHCYAETLARRFGIGWGPGAERKLTSPSNWKLPRRWNRKAEKLGVRYKVFPSLCDPFDAEVPDAWRDRLFALIAMTPHLDWLLLTKRPQVALKYITDKTTARADGRGEAAIATGYDGPLECLGRWPLPNLWLGTSVENQAMADLRIPTLLEIPAAKHFLSCEPLLGPVDLFPIEGCLDWVIVGGESGPKARPMHPAWARSIRDQCQAAGVPVFFKQWGEWCPGECVDKPPTRTETGAWWFADQWDFQSISVRASEEMHRDDQPDLYRVGKKAAGRLLDGREWNEAPAGVGDYPARSAAP